MIEQILSYKTVYVNTDTTISCALKLAHKNWHQRRCPTVTVTTAETHHPPLHYAYIHHLLSMNVRQASVNVNGCHFFPHRGIQFHTFASYALPCQKVFVRLLLCCHLPHSNKMEWNTGGKVQPLLP